MRKLAGAVVLAALPFVSQVSGTPVADNSYSIHDIHTMMEDRAKQHPDFTHELFYFADKKMLYEMSYHNRGNAGNGEYHGEALHFTGRKHWNLVNTKMSQAGFERYFSRVHRGQTQDLEAQSVGDIFGDDVCRGPTWSITLCDFYIPGTYNPRTAYLSRLLPPISWFPEDFSRFSLDHESRSGFTDMIQKAGLALSQVR